jgi:hypothetical protein
LVSQRNARNRAARSYFKNETNFRFM